MKVLKLSSICCVKCDQLKQKSFHFKSITFDILLFTQFWIFPLKNIEEDFLLSNTCNFYNIVTKCQFSNMGSIFLKTGNHGMESPCIKIKKKIVAYVKGCLDVSQAKFIKLIQHKEKIFQTAELSFFICLFVHLNSPCLPALS